MTRILFIEDSADDSELLTRTMAREGLTADTERVEDTDGLRAALDRGGWDVFIADYSMPRFSGLDALRMVRESEPDTPFIVVSGTVDEDHAVAAMKAGAQDFVSKSNTARLVPALKRELKEAENRRGRRLAEERARRLAYYDDLTGLPNRNWLTERLQECLPRAQRQRQPIALMVLHLDRFREINDTLGYATADELLAQAANRLHGTVGQRAGLVRLGGAEFVLVVEGGMAAARALVDELTASFEHSFRIGRFNLDVTPYFGIALFPEHGTRDHVLLQHADVALTAARSSGNTSALYDPARDPCSPRSLALAGDMRAAMSNREYMLYYQPKIDLRDRRITGFEALLRWSHPKRGMVPPGEFIPLAERCGLINPLTRHVAQLLATHHGNTHDDLGQLSTALNLSPRNLLDSRLVADLHALIQDGVLDPDRLELEITETAIMEDPDTTVANLTRLADHGIRVYIDDFGTGFSSLVHLKRLPIDGIKIDKSFVIDMLDNPGSATIVRSTIDLAHNLGLEVIAEGIEDEQTWKRLQELGCETGQGFYIGRPIPGDEIGEWMRGWQLPAARHAG